MTVLEAETLQRQAEAGDAAAMAEWGARLLIGKDAPRAPQDGLAWLQRGVECGGAEAAAQLATLHAAGAWMPQNFDAALDLLQRAAEGGSDFARVQLRVLALGDPRAEAARADPGSPGVWRDVRQAVSVEQWLSPPAKQNLWEAPRVRCARGFTTPDVCGWLISRAQGRMEPATLYKGDTKIAEFDAARTCSDYQFDIVNAGVVLQFLRARIAKMTGLIVPAMEPPRVFHYALGEEIKPHYDRLVDGTSGYGGDGGYQGDRIVTFLLYLNDDYDGGDLDFPRVNFRCKGKTGDAVYFAHVDGAGKPEKLSLHASIPITRGEKWIFSQWIHDRPFGA